MRAWHWQPTASGAHRRARRTVATMSSSSRQCADTDARCSCRSCPSSFIQHAPIIRPGAYLRATPASRRIAVVFCLWGLSCPGAELLGKVNSKVLSCEVLLKIQSRFPQISVQQYNSQLAYVPGFSAPTYWYIPAVCLNEQKKIRGTVGH